MRSFLTNAIGAVALACAVNMASGAATHAESAKPIKIVISVPPGGAIDFLVRVLTDHIGKAHDQTFLIESRPGAGSVIAAETVARAAPDGNTLLINNNGMVINAMLRKVGYDPVESFEPICDLVSSPQVLVVNSTSRYRTFADLLDAARAKPGELSIASVGPNTTQHFVIERLKRLAKVNLTYVPFTGGAPAINALLGEHITAVLQNYSEVSEQIAAGKLRALVTPSAERIEPLPELPTIAESGFKDLEADVWFGLVAPAKTPKDVTARLIDWFRSALLTPDVKKKLALEAQYPRPICGADFAAHIRRQAAEYARLIRDLNLKGE